MVACNTVLSRSNLAAAVIDMRLGLNITSLASMIMLLAATLVD